MNRKEQQFLRQRQTTRQLMGVTRLTEHGAVCGRDELLFYLLRPDNLSILSPEGIRGRVRALTGLLQGMASLELLALDSRESFLKNKQYYQRRLEEEPSPALRELLRQDMEHLDARQSSTAASREFVLVCSTASATLPAEEAKAGMTHRVAPARTRSSTRMPFFLILILTPP